MRFNDTELSLIKNTFSGDNEEIITLIRKVFLQDKLTKNEINQLAFISENPKLLMLCKKTFYPEIEVDSPLHQMVDLWMTVDVKEKSPSEVVEGLKVRAKLSELILEGLQRLEEPKEKGGKNLVDYTPDFTETDGDTFTRLVSRTAMIQHVEMQLAQLVLLAGQKEETVEETLTRLEKNSAK